MGKMTWEQAGELMENIPEDVSYFYRLSYLKGKNKWICSIDGVDGEADNPKDAIHEAVTKYSTHILQLDIELAVGQKAYTAEHLTIQEVTIEGFDHKSVILRKNAWSLPICYTFDSFNELWFMDKETAVRHLKQDKKQA